MLNNINYFLLLLLCHQTWLGALLVRPHVSSTQYQQMVTAAKTQALQEKFKNTLLVINFNHPYYNNIPFLKKLYSPFFSNIVFYGEQQHPEVTASPTHTGYLFCGVMQDVLTKYPDFSGYLFLEDDCILNVWNCAQLNVNAIWYPVTNPQPNASPMQHAFHLANMQTGANTHYWWWKTPWGYAPAKRAYDQLLPSDLVKLESTFGKYNLGGNAADMFYIPARFRADALRLAPLFANVFIEIAVPCIISCLDYQYNWAPTSILWGQVNVGNWPTQFTCVHPVKLSSISNQNRTLYIFSSMMMGK